MRLIPAIDIINGECVRLTRGDYNRKTSYSFDVPSLAKVYEQKGIKYLHVVDLDAAKSKSLVNFSLVETICKETSLQVDYGGGISSAEDIRRLLNAGVAQVNVGSIALKDKALFLKWLYQFGPDKIVLSADALHGKMRADAWTRETEIEVLDFIKNIEAEGLKYVVCTDIAKDGLLSGPSFKLYNQILAEASLKLIASGGVSTKEDILRLKKIGCDGAIIGKALYENYLSISEIVGLC